MPTTRQAETTETELSQAYSQDRRCRLGTRSKTAASSASFRAAAHAVSGSGSSQGPTTAMMRLIMAALCLLALTRSASALVLPGNRTLPDRELIPLACQHVEDGWTVCHPYAEHKYITCGQHAKASSCPRGTLYDYVIRRCLPEAYAKPCKVTRCPLSRSWAPSNVTRFGISPLFGSYANQSDLSDTILLDKAGITSYLCPSASHCMHGMTTNVVTLPDPPRDRPAKNHVVEWTEILQTYDLYPQHVEDVIAYIGDTVTFHWDLPLHNIVSYDSSAPDAAPYIPYAPQPRFTCPFWPFDFSNSSINEVVQVSMLPRGEVRYVNETFMSFGATGMDFGPGTGFNLTATQDMNRKFVVCPHPSHCRLGMIFQLFVQPAPADYTPQLHRLAWDMIEYWNFPDMNITAGDTINFYTPPPYRTADGGFDFTAIQIYALSVIDEDLVERLYF